MIIILLPANSNSDNVLEGRCIFSINSSPPASQYPPWDAFCDEWVEGDFSEGDFSEGDLLEEGGDFEGVAFSFFVDGVS